MGGALAEALVSLPEAARSQSCGRRAQTVCRSQPPKRPLMHDLMTW